MQLQPGRGQLQPRAQRTMRDRIRQIAGGQGASRQSVAQRRKEGDRTPADHRAAKCEPTRGNLDPVTGFCVAAGRGS